MEDLKSVLGNSSSKQNYPPEYTYRCRFRYNFFFEWRFMQGQELIGGDQLQMEMNHGTA